MKFKKGLLGVLLVMLAASAGNGVAWAAGDSKHAAQTESQMHKQHMEKRFKLTQEHQDAMKQAGVDLQALRETERKLRSTVSSIRQQGKKLRESVKGNPELKQQVKQDLLPVSKQMLQARELRLKHQQLRESFKAAVQAKDTAKIKQAYTALRDNQQQALQLLNQIDTALKAEVRKIQG